jgi:hypothetical protein
LFIENINIKNINNGINMTTVNNCNSQTIDSSSLSSPPELQTENFQERNAQVLNELKQEFGAEVTQRVWNRIDSGFRESFDAGSKDLASYKVRLRAQGQAIGREIAQENNDLLGELKNTYSDDIVDQVYNLIPEFKRELLEEGKLSLQNYRLSIENQCEKLVALQNSDLLKTLKNTYSNDIVNEVYALIPESKRESLEEGKLSLQKFLLKIEGKCQELSKSTILELPEVVIGVSADGELPEVTNEELPEVTIGVLPEGQALQTFLTTAKVTKYIGATQGAFFIAGSHIGSPLTIVAKAADKPRQEFFANTLYSRLRIKTPKTIVTGTTCERKTAKQLKKVLEKSAEFNKKYPKGSCPKMFLVMSCIEGNTLANLQASDILDSETGKPYDEIYDQVLVDIGQIAAADYLLFYRDRLPTIGLANLDNFVIHKDPQGKCIGAVAIDQVASLNAGFKGNLMIGCDTLERIQEIITEIMSDTSRISEQARTIFGALPESVRQTLDEQKALEAIQKGLISGLFKVAELGTPELLDELYKNLPILPKQGYSRDGVDLQIHKQMLAKIKELVLKQS